jgi:hypothetical protein
VVKYSDWKGWYTDGAIEKEYYDSSYEDFYTTDNLVQFDENGSGYTRFDWLLMSTVYSVLDTDYTQYAVVYGCDNWFWGMFHSEQVWILSRDTVASDSVIETA